jgi:hypothetical protein
MMTNRWKTPKVLGILEATTKVAVVERDLGPLAEILGTRVKKLGKAVLMAQERRSLCSFSMALSVTFSTMIVEQHCDCSGQFQGRMGGSILFSVILEMYERRK